MSEAKTLPRPPQTTMASWMVIVASGLMVANMYSYISALTTLEERERVTELLKEQPFVDLGLDVQQALNMFHILAVVAGGLAAVTLVLGVFALRRHKGAHIGLAVAALPMLLLGSAISSGGFSAVIVSAASVMLWLQPSRDWFAGIAMAKPQPREQPIAMGPGTDVGTPPTQPNNGSSASSGRHVAGQAQASAKRPQAVTFASLLAMMCGVLALGAAIALLVIPDGQQSKALSEIEEQNPGLREQITDLGYNFDTFVLGTIAAFLALIGLLGLIAGLLLWLGHTWIRLPMVVGAVTVAVLCIPALLSGGYAALFPAIAGMWAAALLMRPESVNWPGRKGKR